MTEKTITRQFGLWSSQISPRYLSEGMRIADALWDESGYLVWLESRSGRSVCVIQPPNGDAPRDLNSTYSVRARVGYGGGDFSVSKGHVYFVEAESARIFKQPISSGVPIPITPGFGMASSPTISPDGRWLLFIRSFENRDSLEIVDTRGENWPQKLVSGNDFYMQPDWHPGSKKIAWISWDHPNMPWDTTSLWMGDLSVPPNGAPFLENIGLIAGHENTSIFQPQFSPDGSLLAYVSDVDGWWQLYVYDLKKKKHRQLTKEQAEHAKPAWVQGMRTYAFSPDSQWIYFIRNKAGQDSLWKIRIEDGMEFLVNLDTVYTSLEQISVSEHGIAVIASSGSIPTRLITCTLPEEPNRDGEKVPLTTQVKRRTMSEEFDARIYSDPENIKWEGEDGEEAHGIFYRPNNPKYSGVGKPPLIMSIHGGPTSQVGSQFNSKAQFFTSRGYAFLEVNYRGSTGYGRDYRNKLKGMWGEYDVLDAVNGAKHLSMQGLVDPERIVIMGGSAGGFTVYKAMEDFPEFFRAGISLYGVSNQFALAADTHKFEERYTDSLLGPLPEAANLYRERSPLFFADRIKRPLAIFQGEDDLVVPKNQSDEMVDVLRRKGIPVVYHVYPGEGHGFRKSETIFHMYQQIEKFLENFVIYI